MADTSSGKYLEKYVLDYFIDKNFQEMSFVEYQVNTQNTQNLIVTNIPYISIYGSKCRTEFLAVIGDRKIRIECKWQGVSGSVDEKFCYLYHNAAEVWEENEIILIIDGKGYKPQAVEWIKTSADNRKYIESTSNKIIKVFTLADFLDWANDGMKHLSEI